MDNDNSSNIDNVNILQDVETCVKNDSVTSDNGNKDKIQYKVNGEPKLTPGIKPIIDRVTPELLDELEGYASQDTPNVYIAKALGMALSSFYKLMNISPEFKDAYNRGLESRKYEIEKSLFRRATGFMAEEKQTVVTEDPEKGTIIKNTVTQKNYVPDSVAAIFALKNLMPDKYKDRVESVSTINVNVQQLQNLPDEELLKYINVESLDYSIE